MKMVKRGLGTLTVVSVMAMSGSVWADEIDCPPGAVCEEVEIEPTVPDPPEVPPEPPARPRPDPIAKPAPPTEGGRTVIVHHGGPGGDQVVIYEPGTAPPHVPGATGDSPDGLPPLPGERKRRRRYRPFGLSLRAQGVLMPQDRDDIDVGMAGLGASMRYRPIRYFAFDAGFDVLGGTDTNGYDRSEFNLSASGIFYVNPRSLAQFYLLGGVNFGFASVESQTPLLNFANNTEDNYSYVGGHGGVGLEFRVSRLIGIHVDGLVFARTRTDDGADLYPEYVDPVTGDTSNSSVGGLMRAGVNFWW